MTAGTLIYGALRHIGRIKRAGQGASPSELADGLAKLNNLLDSWSTERLNIFAISLQNFPLTTGTQSYTIGAGATFNTARPIRIESAGILTPNTGGFGNLRFALELADEKRWAAIVEKGATSDIAQTLYNDHAAPLSTLYLWPLPTFTGMVQLELGLWQALTQFADLTTDYSFATGYVRAIEYALAIELAPSFGAELTAALTASAAEAKAAIRALNGAQPNESTGAAPLNAVPTPPEAPAQ